MYKYKYSENLEMTPVELMWTIYIINYTIIESIAKYTGCVCNDRLYFKTINDTTVYFGFRLLNPTFFNMAFM